MKAMSDSSVEYLHFFPNSIVNNTAEDSNACREPVATVREMNSKSLFAQSFGSRLSIPQYVTPDDFGLDFSVKASFPVISVMCQGWAWNGGVGADGGLQGSWIAMQSPNVALIHWYDDTLLVLKKIPVRSVPTPSFNCKFATLLAERTICSSFELAGLDLSVSAAYRGALTQIDLSDNVTFKRALIRSQTQWIKNRDNCGTNDSCLANAMSKRLQELHDLRRSN
jgi:uncharacterized protein YecT (DUF1311 family)